MNKGFWERLYEANKIVEATDRLRGVKERYGYPPTKAEPLGDSNMPEGRPLATIGKCLACGTAWYVEDRELGNGLCPEHWDDCVDKMTHYASVDPDFEIWKELCSP